MNQNEALKAKAEKILKALRVPKKPRLHTRRLLVGHEYLASQTVAKTEIVQKANQLFDVPSIAIALAKRLAFENGDGIPRDAKQYVFIAEQGYIVTFAWIEWVVSDVKQTADITHLGRLSSEME